MNIHEYQAKEVLARYGVPVPKGIPVDTPDQAAKAFADLGGGLAVVKAQIHAGGRGKAGGVKLVRTKEEARAIAEGLIGRVLVTPQTGPEGRVVKKLYVTQGAEIAREMYLAVAMDRNARAPVVIAAAEGGVDIEDLAHNKPAALLRVPVHPVKGVQPFQVRRICFHLGLKGEQLKSGAAVINGLLRAFLDTDASLAEINPLIVTKDGNVLALDAKLSFDDNALFRHKDLAAYRDLNEEDPKEVEAKSLTSTTSRSPATSVAW